MTRHIEKTGIRLQPRKRGPRDPAPPALGPRVRGDDEIVSRQEFLTASFRGGGDIVAANRWKSDPVPLSPSADQGLGNGSRLSVAPRSATQRVRGNEASSRVDEIDDYRRVRSAEPGARVPVGDRGRGCDRYSTGCRSAEIRRLISRWRRGLLVVSQALGSGLREGQGRDLSRPVTGGNLRPRCRRPIPLLFRCISAAIPLQGPKNSAVI